MRENLNNKTITILFFVFIILILIPIIFIGVKFITDFRSGATLGNDVTYSHKILNNVGDRFSVAWITETSVNNPGIRYGVCSSSTNVDPSTLSLSGVNDVDVGGGSSNVHMFSAIGLQPDTKYCFQITNLEEENGASSLNSIVYEITTLPKVNENLSTPSFLIGEVPSTDINSIVTVVMLERGSGRIISNEIGAPSSSTGTWSIPINSFRTSSGEEITNSILDNSLYFISSFKMDQAEQFLEASSSKIIETTQDLEEIITLTDQDKETVADASKYTSNGEPIDSEFPSVTPTQETSAELPTEPSPIQPTNPQQAGNQPVEIITDPEIVNADPAGNTFAVIWETNIPTESYIEYSINGTEAGTAYDPRSGRVFLRKLRTHYFEIIDTINQQAEYKITIVNNGIRTTTITHTRKGVSSFPSSPKPALNLSLEKNGNFIDQIIIAHFEGESSKIATYPNVNGTSQLDVTKFAKLSDPTSSFDPDTADVPISFSMLGGEITESIDTEYKNISTIIEVPSQPKDTSGFEIKFIEINDSTDPIIIGGEGIESGEIVIEKTR